MHIQRDSVPVLFSCEAVKYYVVIPQNEYGILVITRDQGAAEVEC